MPLIVHAGGMGGMGGMSGSGMSTLYTTQPQYYYTTGRTNAYSYGYPNYYNTGYYNTGYYTYPRYNTVVTPTTTIPYNWGSPYVLGGWPYNYGGNTVPVTTKDYTVEKSYTQYLPGGELTTTLGETTDTDIISVSNNLFPYNQTYGYGAGSLLLNPYYSNYGYPYHWGSTFIW